MVSIDSLIVSMNELHSLSNCSSVKGVIGWLRKNKIPFAIGADGIPRVARGVFNQADGNLCSSELFQELFENQMLFDRRCVGIYMLIYDGDVVYVGRTTTFFVRMAAHDKGDFEWDRVVFCPTEKSNLDVYEAELIARYSPKYNISMVPQKKPPRTANGL